MTSLENTKLRKKKIDSCLVNDLNTKDNKIKKNDSSSISSSGFNIIEKKKLKKTCKDDQFNFISIKKYSNKNDSINIIPIKCDCDKLPCKDNDNFSDKISVNSNSVKYNYSTNDINKYLLKTPKAPSFGIPFSTSTSIYIPFEPPEQKMWGSLGYIPLINSITIEYNCKTSNSTSIINRTILNEVSGSEYYKITGLTSENDTNQVKGIVLIKYSPIQIGNLTVNTGQIQNIHFPQDNNGSLISGTTRKAYIYTDSMIQNMIFDQHNNISIYYKNYSTDVKKGVVYFDIFVLAGIPSNPLNLVVNNITNTTAIASYQSPQYGDNSNKNFITPIENYKINYYSMSNNISFTNFNRTNNTITFPGTIYQLSELYPDTNYIIEVSAKNVSNSNYGPKIATSFTTMESVMSPLLTKLDPINFNISSYSAKKVYDDSLVNNLIFSSNNIISSLPFTFFINETTNRGKLGTGILMSLNANLSGAKNISGPSVNFTGFPATKPQSINLNGIEINPTDVFDYTTNVGFTGYYLKGTSILNIDTSILDYSPEEYVISLSRNGYTSQNETYNFFYDTQTNLPTIGGNPFSIITNQASLNNQNGYIPINGVYIVIGNIILDSLIYNITNIGHYFYNNTQIISYHDSANNLIGSEVDLTNVVSGKLINELDNSVTIQNNNIQYSSPQNYTDYFTLKTVAYNIKGQTGSYSSVVPIIFDYPSYQLVYRTFIQSFSDSLLGNLSPGLPGYRCWISPVSDTTTPYLPDLYYIDSNLNNISYSNIPYDNTCNISVQNYPHDYSQESLVSNGSFVTRLSNYGYRNYSGYTYGNQLYNSFDYSVIPAYGYRYCNFAWNVPLPTVQGFTKLYINILNTNIRASYSNGVIYANSEILQFYYRCEDKNDLIPSSSSYSTYWINGNTINGSTISSVNYFNNQVTYNGGNIPTINDNNILFALNLPFIITSLNSSNITIYVRIGLPQTVDFSFSNVLGYLQ